MVTNADLDAIHQRDAEVPWTAEIMGTPTVSLDYLWQVLHDRHALLSMLEPERVAVAINTAQIDPAEMKLGRDLRIPARRILAALSRTEPSRPSEPPIDIELAQALDEAGVEPPA